MTISQAKSGRWWWCCTLPCCGEYDSGYPDQDRAYQAAKRHERGHR